LVIVVASILSELEHLQIGSDYFTGKNNLKERKNNAQYLRIFDLQITCFLFYKHRNFGIRLVMLSDFRFRGSNYF